MQPESKANNPLILLIGSNPLPNYLAARVLQPKSLHLYYTVQTTKPRDYLKKALKTAYPSLEPSESCISGDGTIAQDVEKACNDMPKGGHLHYTGGTKVMAARARMAFRNQGGIDSQCSYLDERNGVLRFDSGEKEIDLSTRNLGLTLETVLGLHGINGNKTWNKPEWPTTEDAMRIADKVLRDPAFDSKSKEVPLSTKLYDEHNWLKKQQLKKSLEAPFYPEELSLNLSTTQIPGMDWTAKRFETWHEFLGGKWLELWVAAIIRTCDVGKPSIGEISVGINCVPFYDRREFEIDVAVIRGHRLYVISCTTDTKIGLCKSKLFEVAMRARQLGGDLARSALVCLLHGNDSKGDYRDQLQSDVSSIWEAANTPCVFGLNDLREWAGTHGSVNTSRLCQWLTS